MQQISLQEEWLMYLSERQTTDNAAATHSKPDTHRVEIITVRSIMLKSTP